MWTGLLARAAGFVSGIDGRTLKRAGLGIALIAVCSFAYCSIKSGAREEGRSEVVIDLQRESLDTARRGTAARHEAQTEVQNEMRDIRLPTGEPDLDRLRELCAADPDCRGERLLMDGTDQLEPR